MTSKYVVSVLVADRPGIMRDLTSAITELGANIDGISQTVVEGYFSVVLTASFGEPRVPAELEAAVVRGFEGPRPAMVIRAFEPVPPSPGAAGGQTYILIITGKDRPGILKRATACLAEKAINIESWDCHIENAAVTYIAALTVPPRLEIDQVQRELRARLAELGMNVRLQHENIFRATNEIGPIAALLKETRHA